MLIAATLAVACATASCRSSAAAASSPPPEAFGNAWQGRLRAAVASAGEDQLHRLFTRVRTIRLTGGNLHALDRLAQSPDGTWVTSDVATPAVSVFDRDGRFVRRIGAKGSSPGQYQLPSGIGVLNEGQVAVLDFDPKRIAIFDRSGRFVRSQAYSMHSFSGQALSTSPASVMSVFGVSAPGGRRGAESRLVHQFTADGAHIRSVLALPTDVPGWMWSYLDASLSQAADGLYVGVAPRYAPFLIAPDGQVTSTPVVGPATFRAPVAAFDSRALMPKVSGPPTDELKRRFYLAYQDWRLSWTPVEAVGRIGDLLFVEYQTFNPLRYTLDVWSMDGRPVLLDQLRTNLRLLAVTADGEGVFRENVDSRGNAEPAIVVMAAKKRRLGPS